MDITKVNLFAQQIAGNPVGEGFLISIAPAYYYENNMKTDKISCYKYTVVFDMNDFEKVNVKVKASKPLLTDEQLASQKGKIRVRLKNLTGRFYRTDRGEYALTCSADEVEVVS